MGNGDLAGALTKYVSEELQRLMRFGPPARYQLFESAKNLAQQYAQSGGLFMGRLGTSAFPKVSRKIFANQLQFRLDYPNSTHQGDTYLCGPAAATHLLLNLDPLNYLKVAIMLFETGRARIAEDDFIASDTMKKLWEVSSDGLASQTNGESGAMGVVDYAILGSLRYAENWSNDDADSSDDDFDPQNGEDNIGQGTPPGDMGSFLEDYCGFDVPNMLYWAGKEDPHFIQKALSEGKWVVLFIDPHLSDTPSSKVEGKAAKGQHGIAKEKKGLSLKYNFGSHFVVVDPDVDFKITNNNGDKRVSFEYWHYGGRFTPVNTTEAQFISSVKGYWIVEPKYQKASVIRGRLQPVQPLLKGHSSPRRSDGRRQRR